MLSICLFLSRNLVLIAVSNTLLTLFEISTSNAGTGDEYLIRVFCTNRSY